MKEAILNTAEQLCLKYGLRSVSIDDICNELHISKKTFYSYFKQKEQLVQAILDDGIRKRSAEKRVNDKEQNIVDSILDNNAYFVSQKSSTKRNLAFYYDLQKYYPTMYAQFSAKMRELDRQYLADILVMGKNQGWFREGLNIEFTSLLIAEMITTLMSHKIEGMSMTDIINMATDTLLRITCNKQGIEYYMKKTKRE